jgi:hypothetical protein
MKSKKGYKTKRRSNLTAQVSPAQDRQDDINILKMIRRGDLGPMNDKLREAEQTILGRLRKA